VFERRVMLKDEADSAALRWHTGHVAAVDGDRATVGGVQTGDRPQQSGLSRTAGA
jgi:hypothetical protein